MKKFCFVVADSSGNTKAGSLEADNEDEARKTLEENDLTIVSFWEPDPESECAPEADEPALQRAVEEGSGRADGSCGPVEPSGVEAGKGGAPVNGAVYVPDRWKEFRRQTSASPSISRIAAALVILATVFISALVVLSSSLPTSSAAPPSDSCRQVNIVIRGRVETASKAGVSGKLPDVKICFQFPEVPLEVEKMGREVFTDGNGDFTARFSFRSREVPSFFGLTVKGSSYTAKTMPHLALSGDKTLECTVPDIRLSSEL